MICEYRRPSIRTQGVELSLYADPEIYDIVHADATAEQFETLLGLASGWELRAEDGAWLEPACGSGRLLAAAEDAGFRVAGFDLEPKMIEYARSHLSSKAQLEVADLRSFSSRFDAGSVSLAFNLINTIRHLDSDAAMLEHFKEVSEVLAPGGRYVVGISLTDYSDHLIEEDVWRGERDGINVVQIVQALPPRRSRQERIVSHLVIETPGKETEHRDDRYSLRSYSPAEWNALVDASPLVQTEQYDLFGEQLPALECGYKLCILATRP